jgi:hypothetical protein
MGIKVAGIRGDFTPADRYRLLVITVPVFQESIGPGLGKKQGRGKKKKY